jgi:hypothetical protein
MLNTTGVAFSSSAQSHLLVIRSHDRAEVSLISIGAPDFIVHCSDLLVHQCFQSFALTRSSVLTLMIFDTVSLLWVHARYAA